MQRIQQEEAQEKLAHVSPQRAAQIMVDLGKQFARVVDAIAPILYVSTKFGPDILFMLKPGEMPDDAVKRLSDLFEETRGDRWAIVLEEWAPSKANGTKREHLRGICGDTALGVHESWSKVLRGPAPAGARDPGPILTFLDKPTVVPMHHQITRLDPLRKLLSAPAPAG